MTATAGEAAILFAECLFEQNQAPGFGGALFGTGALQSVTLQQCQFQALRCPRAAPVCPCFAAHVSLSHCCIHVSLLDCRLSPAIINAHLVPCPSAAIVDALPSQRLLFLCTAQPVPALHSLFLAYTRAVC